MNQNYVKDMQAFDKGFTAIKEIDANTEIEEIISMLKRNHTKKNELYSKMYQISKQIDNIEQKIEEGTQYNWKIMEINKKLISQNEDKDLKQNQIKERRSEIKQE